MGTFAVLLGDENLDYKALGHALAKARKIPFQDAIPIARKSGGLIEEDMEAGAAEAAESAEEILARLRGTVERYARTRVATTLLEGEIERYREANQDPLLRRAGRCFADLTLGSFSGLGIDFDVKDRPVIIGLRPTDERVPLAGLSDGSEDQLYFALRLAAIERYAETSEPVPFIVDDVLIGFDDRRTKAALQVLADLSAHTQVILFTHHRTVADLAEELGENVGVFVQELDS